VTVLRRYFSGLWTTGLISPGWYAVLTGLAMLFVVWLLMPVTGDDPAVPFVALALTLTGIWSIVRGVRLERDRRRG
jgi:hypothetical protein